MNDRMDSMVSRLILLVLGAAILAGCQSAQTLSNSVRAGETIVIGLSGEPGGLLTNTDAEVIRPADLDARLTDASGGSARVRVRNVFRVFGDPTADSLAANRGQWLAVIDLVDNGGTPLQFSPGPATLFVQSDKLFDTLEVDTEILPGVGEINPFLGRETDIEKLGYLDPARQALVSVTGSLDGARLGAAHYRFHVDRESTTTAFGRILAIDSVKLQGRRDIGYHSWVRSNPDGGTDLTVMLTAATGLRENQLPELDLALVSSLLADEEDPQAYFRGSLIEARFYDLQGELLNGLRLSVGAVE